MEENDQENTNSIMSGTRAEKSNGLSVSATPSATCMSVRGECKGKFESISLEVVFVGLQRTRSRPPY